MVKRKQWIPLNKNDPQIKYVVKVPRCTVLGTDDM